MNAPENTPAAYPINLAHEVLLKSDDAMCVDEVARAIIGKKPTKADIKPVAKLLKELADLGLIEMEPRAGGVPFYRLIVASESLPTKTYPPETLRAMIEEHEAEKAGELSFLAPEDYEMPPANPALLASANRMLCDRLEAKDAELLAQAKVVIDLRDRLDALTRRSLEDIDLLTGKNHKLHDEIEHLRSELASERQARQQDQADAVDVKDAAVGYLVRVTKRKPRYVTRPERALDAALAAVRAGAGRAEVLAVVPVGVARRGAEWRGSNVVWIGDVQSIFAGLTQKSERAPKINDRPAGG